MYQPLCELSRVPSVVSFGLVSGILKHVMLITYKGFAIRRPISERDTSIRILIFQNFSPGINIKRQMAGSLSVSI